MNTQQPEALRLADRIKSSGQFTNLGELDAAAAELRRLHAENAALQQGYDAARLEIDHLRGATKSKLLAQPVAWMVYLPSIDTQHLYYSQEDMGYVDDVTNHADAEVTPLYEMAAPKAEVAPAYKDSTPELHIGNSAFEGWYSTYSPSHKSDKQRARDAYAAGMGDPLVTAAPAATGDDRPSETVKFVDESTPTAPRRQAA